MDEVHSSNMSKLGKNGKPIRRESDGKVLKGPNYFKPDEEFKKTKVKIGQIASKQNTNILEIRQSRLGNAVLSFASVGDRNTAKAHLKEANMQTRDEDDREIPIHAKGLRADKGEEADMLRLTSKTKTQRSNPPHSCG